MTQSTNKNELRNRAARVLLKAHIAKPLSQTWRYAANVAIETICRTFAIAPSDSEAALLALMAPTRLAQFPHDDLRALAENLHRLTPLGGNVILRVFEAAFQGEPATGSWENFGGRILSMRIQTSDQWNSIHYNLAEFYQRYNGDNARVATEAACIAWNATVRRHQRFPGKLQKTRKSNVLATINFRGQECVLVQDFSYIWDRTHEPEENRIVTRFEDLLRRWASSGDHGKLAEALDGFAATNRTSLLWNIFLQVGADYPASLGMLLADVLSEPTFLINPDYSHAATALFAALHRSGSPQLRGRLEQILVDLPNNARPPRRAQRDDFKSLIERAQNRVLGAIEEKNISLNAVRELLVERTQHNALAPNSPPRSPRLQIRPLTEEEVAEYRGIDTNDTTNQKLIALQQTLERLVPSNADQLDEKALAHGWSIIRRSQETITRYRRRAPKMAQELWGLLLAASEKIAAHANWPHDSGRWMTIRRLLLRGSTDSEPAFDEDTASASCSCWGIPSPRIHAARGLVFLVVRLKKTDRAVANALRRLANDRTATVRLNLFQVIPVLYPIDPQLVWELIASAVAHEQNFRVLDSVLWLLDRISLRERDRAFEAVDKIAQLAESNASAGDHIHETLTAIYLFTYLRTGQSNCAKFIRNVVDHCAAERENKALRAVIHNCRAGGWMTAGDPSRPQKETEDMRQRTWKFLLDLLTSAQTKLGLTRNAWLRLHDAGKTHGKRAKKLQETINRLAALVDGICTQLYFASGAFADRGGAQHEQLTKAQTLRFWADALPLLEHLADEPNPHTAYELVQTLRHLLACDPATAFLLATRSIQTSAAAGFQHESLAADEVVELVERVLADHREIFQAKNGEHPPAMSALLKVLDLFVEAGWPKARRLTHRLEDIYR